jgi:hypothetical protein
LFGVIFSDKLALASTKKKTVFFSHLEMLTARNIGPTMHGIELLSTVLLAVSRRRCNDILFARRQTIENSDKALMCSLSKINVKTTRGNCEVKRLADQSWLALSSGDCADQECSYTCLVSDKLSIAGFASANFQATQSTGVIVPNSTEHEMCVLTKVTDDGSLSSSCEIIRTSVQGWKTISGSNSCGYSCATFTSVTPTTPAPPTITRPPPTTTIATTGVVIAPTTVPPTTTRPGTTSPGTTVSTTLLPFSSGGMKPSTTGAATTSTASGASNEASGSKATVASPTSLVTDSRMDSAATAFSSTLSTMELTLGDAAIGGIIGGVISGLLLLMGVIVACAVGARINQVMPSLFRS